MVSSEKGYLSGVVSCLDTLSWGMTIAFGSPEFPNVSPETSGKRRITRTTRQIRQYKMRFFTKFDKVNLTPEPAPYNTLRACLISCSTVRPVPSDSMILFNALSASIFGKPRMINPDNASSFFVLCKKPDFS